MKATLTVNGRTEQVDDVRPWDSLLFVLRERLGLYAAKNACEQGECGSCTVLVDGRAICACLIMVAQAQGQAVTTLDGLAGASVAERVQRALVACGGVQCGFCTPGFVVTVTDLLTRRPDAGSDEIREALAGNLCRCTGYRKILQAVEAARATPTPADDASGPPACDGAAGEVA